MTSQGLSDVGDIENGVVESGFYWFTLRWYEVLKFSKNLSRKCWTTPHKPLTHDDSKWAKPRADALSTRILE